MSWFEEWFDSPLYEKLYANRNEDEAALLAGLVEKIIPKKFYPSILDLGCGRGRHSITLAEKGYHVTGIDLSKEAIKKARKRAEKKKLSNVSFKIGDMRKPLNSTFDAVVNLFTTFGYFLHDEENIRVLRSISAMLRPRGALILDYLNPEKVTAGLVPKETGNYGEFHYDICRTIQNGMVYKTIRFTGKDLKEPVQYQERVKLYNLAWFQEHLAAEGFELQDTLGDYSGHPYAGKTSSRLLMIATKREEHL